jgi:chromosome segregation ATPase
VENVSSDVKRLTGSVQGLSKNVSDLQSAHAMAQAAQTRVRELLGTVGELTSRMESLSPAKVSRELDDRAQQLEEVRSRLGALERTRADWDAVIAQTDRSLEQVRERYQAVEVLRTDLQRVFTVADETVKQVRAVVELQQQIEQRRELLDPVLAKLRELDQRGAALDEREKRFAEAEERVARLDALLIDLQSTLQTVLGQKEFLERVVETSGNLALQTMQAEAMINQLRQDGEEVKSRRTRGG